MSSEEVAELAEAIHSHADALYESWRSRQLSQESNLRMSNPMEDTLELLADPSLTPSLETFVSNFVKRDRAKQRHPGNMAGNSRTRSLSPRIINNGETSTISPLNGHGSRKALPRSILEVVQRFESTPPERKSPSRVPSPSQLNSLAGIGPVTSRQIEEKLYGHTFLNPSHRDLSDPPSLLTSHRTHQNSPIREHRIPITQPSDNTSVPQKDSRGRDLQTNSIHIINVNITAPTNPKSPTVKDLEREEERLVQALRTGTIIDGNRRNHPTNSHWVRTDPDFRNNNNSRIAFAKERIRQSQEHPLTQQRLELQKRLPAPTSTLASAVALQQGKNKFQPKLNGSAVTSDTRHHHISIEREDGSGRKSPNRQVWTIHRFTGPGSSVADRVQQFEKYPTVLPTHGNGTSESSRAIPITTTNHNLSTTSQLYSEQSSGSKEITHPITQMDSNFHDPPQYNKPNWNSLESSHALNQIENVRNFPDRNSDRVFIVAPWRNINHQITKPDSTSPKYIRSPTVSSPCSDILKKSDKRASILGNREVVPRFYWAEGKPPPPTSILHDTLIKAEVEFTKISSSPLNYEEFGNLLVKIGICLYWKKPFWMGLGLRPNDSLLLDNFKKFYNDLISTCPDEGSRFLRIIWMASKPFMAPNGLPSRTIPRHPEVTMSDFVPMIQDIVDTHPGLGFLREAPEFHSRYVTTVISRIFYKVNRSWTGRVNYTELRRSNLLRIIRRLEEETDVNTITDYFSYEHFYVIYCKFWELDKDHDLLIDKTDLIRHNEHALSSQIVDRIFSSGTVLRGWDINSNTKCPPGKMTYSDFVWFLLSEEDKKTHMAIEYWFRCLDLDGDGLLSPYELQYFYIEQERRIEGLGIEPLDFSNVYCQMVDMLRCSPNGVRLTDLKNNPQLASNFFNTLFNLDKYLDHEQRDPFASSGSSISGLDITESGGESDWDRYAASEYELLIAEESPNDQMLHDSSDFEDLIS